MQEKNLNELQEKIGYKFTDEGLLKNALTHTSYAYEYNVGSLTVN